VTKDGQVRRWRLQSHAIAIARLVAISREFAMVYGYVHNRGTAVIVRDGVLANALSAHYAFGAPIMHLMRAHACSQASKIVDTGARLRSENVAGNNKHVFWHSVDAKDIMFATIAQPSSPQARAGQQRVHAAARSAAWRATHRDVDRRRRGARVEATSQRGVPWHLIRQFDAIVLTLPDP
jgi:hypothetical protein